MGDDNQNPINEDTDEFGIIGVKSQSYHQSQMHSDYNSADSIVASDLEDGQLRKMLASPLKIRGREENSEPSRNPEVSGKPEAMVIQEREVNAQRTQADHSRTESLMSSSSQEPIVPGKPQTMFSVFKHADPSLLEGTKDHFLSQARSELKKQEHQVWIIRYVEAEGKPSKRSKKGGAKGSVAILKASTQSGCVFQDSHPRKLFLREPGMLGSKHAVKFTKRYLAPNHNSGKKGPIARYDPKVCAS